MVSTPGALQVGLTSVRHLSPIILPAGVPLGNLSVLGTPTVQAWLAPVPVTSSDEPALEVWAIAAIAAGSVVGAVLLPGARAVSEADKVS